MKSFLSKLFRQQPTTPEVPKPGKDIGLWSEIMFRKEEVERKLFGCSYRTRNSADVTPVPPK